MTTQYHHTYCTKSNKGEFFEFFRFCPSSKRVKKTKMFKFTKGWKTSIIIFRLCTTPNKALKRHAKTEALKKAKQCSTMEPNSQQNFQKKMTFCKVFAENGEYSSSNPNPKTTLNSLLKKVQAHSGDNALTRLSNNFFSNRKKNQKKLTERID